jgi:hypothetical protein
LFARYRRAIAAYDPAPYPGRLAVLRSETMKDLRPSLGWSAIGKEVELHRDPRRPFHVDHEQHRDDRGAAARVSRRALRFPGSDAGGIRTQVRRGMPCGGVARGCRGGRGARRDAVAGPR